MAEILLYLLLHRGFHLNGKAAATGVALLAVVSTLVSPVLDGTVPEPSSEGPVPEAAATAVARYIESHAEPDDLIVLLAGVVLVSSPIVLLVGLAATPWIRRGGLDAARLVDSRKARRPTPSAAAFKYRTLFMGFSP